MFTTKGCAKETSIARSMVTEIAVEGGTNGTTSGDRGDGSKLGYQLPIVVQVLSHVWECYMGTIVGWSFFGVGMQVNVQISPWVVSVEKRCACISFTPEPPGRNSVCTYYLCVNMYSYSRRFFVVYIIAS